MDSAKGSYKNISVVIPTYNRKNMLRSTLLALEDQSLSKDNFEVIVVSGGSMDEIEEFFEKSYYSFPLQHIKKQNKGPARARNEGIKHSKYDLILFLDDDTQPLRNCLLEHIKMHNLFDRFSVIGKTTSPFIRSEIRSKYPNVYGLPRMQRLVHKLKDGEVLGWDLFISNNLSVKKSLSTVAMFNQSFPYASYEDIELGYRLHEIGVQLIFAERAEALHFQYRSFEETSCWAVRNGYSKMIMIELHPQLWDHLVICDKYNFKKPLDLLKIDPMPPEKEIKIKNEIQRLERELLCSPTNKYVLKRYQRESSKLYAYMEAMGMRKRLQERQKYGC